MQNLLKSNLVGRIEAASQVLAKVEELKEGFVDLIKNGKNLMNGPAAYINLNKEVSPKFFKPRSLPYASYDIVAAELDRICWGGILSPVSHSDWTTSNSCAQA